MATGKKATRRTKEKSPAPHAPGTVPSAGPADSGNFQPPPGSGEDRIAAFLKLSAREMAFECFYNAEVWLDAPNPQFHGRNPNDLLGTEEERKVYNLLAAYALGLR